MRKPLDIAIAGAGISGLACATLLARAGHSVTLYERFETSRPLGSGLMLQPTGLAALERLGLRGEIEVLGELVARLHGTTCSGIPIFDLAYGDLDPRFYAVCIHRAALHGALWRAFFGSGAMLETGRTVADVETQAGGRVSITDEHARSLGPFDLVIDASGARSRLRRRVTASVPGEFAYGAVWASVPDIGVAPAALAQRDVAAKVMIGYLPVGAAQAGGPRLAALFWSLKPSDYPAWRDGFEPWRERTASLWPELAPVVSGLKSPDDMTLASYVQFTARVPFRGPLVLIGDSAHATSPQLGQGANSGMLDAPALADALDMSEDIPAALQLYAKARRAHVRFYQLASRIMTPFFQSDSNVLGTTRDLTFNRMTIVPYMKREMLRALAGLKTGLFMHQQPERLADMSRIFR